MNTNDITKCMQTLLNIKDYVENVDIPDIEKARVLHQVGTVVNEALKAGNSTNDLSIPITASIELSGIPIVLDQYRELAEKYAMGEDYKTVLEEV